MGLMQSKLRLRRLQTTLKLTENHWSMVATTLLSSATLKLIQMFIVVARIDLGVLVLIACTVCTTVTQKLNAVTARLAVWRMVMLDSVQRVLHYAVRMDVRKNWRMMMIHGAPIAC